MAQIFKTISLEERLRASTYNQLPQKPQPVNQGEGIIKLPTPPNQSQPAQLKITIDAQEKNSAILKDIARTAGVQILPTIATFQNTGLTRFAIPLANTQFRTNINLADRLAQPDLGTTRHLPQFFLADFYTDYITISRFGIFNHTSNIIVSQPVGTPNQGGLNPVNIVFTPNHTSNIQPLVPIGDFILQQGGLFSNGTYTSIAQISLTPSDFILLQGGVLIGSSYGSITNVSFPTQDVILQQGAYFSNGVYQSFIAPTSPTAVGFVLQGYGVVPTQPISLQSVYALQGIIITQNQLQSGINITTPITIPTQVPASIVINSPIATPNQGGLDPTPITFEPDRSSPVLRVLGYAAQRALAFFTPRVVHGSADLRNDNFGEQIILGSTIDVYSLGNVLSINPDLVIYVDSLKTNDGNGSAALNYKYENTGQPYEVKIGNIGVYPNYRSNKFERNDAGVLLNTTQDEATLLDLEIEVTEMHQTNKYNPNRLPGDAGPIEIGYRGSLAQYRTLAYDQIATRAANSRTNQNQSDFRSELSANVRGADGNLVGETGVNEEAQVAYDRLGGDTYPEVREGFDKSVGRNSGLYKTLNYDQIVNRSMKSAPNNLQEDFRLSIDNGIGVDGTTGGKPQDRGVSKYVDNRSGFTNGKIDNSDAPNDLVTLKIGSLAFRAFITTFSDSFTINWNDVNYVGRQDTLKAFKGVTRGGSIGFKVAAFNPTDLSNQYRKLNQLVKEVAVGRPTQNNYILGPLTTITVGRWFKNTPVVMNSLKFDVQIADYSWDLDKGVPHLIDVSMDFAVLGDVNGSPLNANTNNYFNYIGQ